MDGFLFKRIATTSHGSPPDDVGITSRHRGGSLPLCWRRHVVWWLFLYDITTRRTRPVFL